MSKSLYDLLDLDTQAGGSGLNDLVPADALIQASDRVDIVPDNTDLDPKAVRLIPQDETSCVGIRLLSDGMLVAFAAMPSPAEVARLEALVGMRIEVGVASSPTSLALLRQRSNTIYAMRSEICEQILDKAIAVHATDIHLSVGSVPKIRVGGHLQSMPGQEVVSTSELNETIKYLIRSDLVEVFPDKKDVDCAATYAGWRLRIAAYHQMLSPAIAIRIIPRDIVGLEDLGLPPVVSAMALDNSSGLVLVCGITGSGKSTTLAAMISLINHQRNCHIVTVEDPVEYIHTEKMATIHQREIGPDAIGFQDALTHALRQDPDVILVGEMRNPETMRMAMDAAETGHLVFATVHSRDAGSVVNRIVSSFPSDQQEHMRTQLAEALIGVVVQKLLPAANDPVGRHVACEIMTNTPAIRNQIREDSLHQIHNTIDTSLEDGMQTFDRDLARLVAAGMVKSEVAKPHVAQMNDFLTHLRTFGHVGD